MLVNIKTSGDTNYGFLFSGAPSSSPFCLYHFTLFLLFLVSSSSSFFLFSSYYHDAAASRSPDHDASDITFSSSTSSSTDQ
jgi:hypothetical protein